jgi:hypothetical protein
MQERRTKVRAIPGPVWATPNSLQV